MNEMWLKTEKAKLDNYVAKIVAKIKDSALAKEVERLASMHAIDPYQSIESFKIHVQRLFGNKLGFNVEDIAVESVQESLVGFHEDVAKKLAKVLDKEKEYTLGDIQKEIPKQIKDMAVLHSDDSKIVADKLVAMGFKISGLDEALNDEEEIKVGDSVIENPDKEGFGFDGQVGQVEKKDEHGGHWTSYLVKFGNEEQEYHDDEIIKAPKK